MSETNVYAVVGSERHQFIEGNGAETHITCGDGIYKLRIAYLIKSGWNVNEAEDSARCIEYYAPALMSDDEASKLMQDRINGDQSAKAEGGKE